jgi:DNA-3-methyladenine glycosylase
VKLTESFYLRQNVVLIAKDLIGKVLVTNVNQMLTSGLIVETEAYSYRERGCHAYRGSTARNKVMFERGGVAYVYLCYGIHQMVNVVTNKKDQAEAVLIRALQPLDGWNIMMKRMNTSTIKKITSGPGKLTKAMGIDQRHNSMNLIGDEIWIEDRGLNTPRSRIMASPRIGIDYAGEDAKLPWRFTLKENEWISR